MKLRQIKLVEANKALAEMGAGRIEKKYIASTIEFVGQLAGIPKRDLHPVGSTGKNQTSGDIDLVVDASKYPPEHAHRRMMTRIGEEHHYFNHGTKIYSYVVPIVKRVNDEFVEVGGSVQVDLIFTASVDWAKFAYHSEGAGESQTSYKGAVRTILLKSVAALYHEPGIDMMAFSPQTGELVIRVGRTFDLQHGLRRIFQYRPERKKGDASANPYVKTMKTVHTLEELEPALQALKQRHPAHFKDIKLDVADHEIIINDPAKVLKLIFPGGPVNTDDVRTAEQILDLISTRFSPDMQIKILNKAKDGIESIAGKMRTPDIDAYIENAESKLE